MDSLELKAAFSSSFFERTDTGFGGTGYMSIDSVTDVGTVLSSRFNEERVWLFKSNSSASSTASSSISGSSSVSAVSPRRSDAQLIALVTLLGLPDKDSVWPGLYPSLGMTPSNAGDGGWDSIGLVSK